MCRGYMPTCTTEQLLHKLAASLLLATKPLLHRLFVRMSIHAHIMELQGTETQTVDVATTINSVG